MLLQFKTTNYKSFRDELVFSMIPAKKQKDLDYSILKKTVGKKIYKGLSSAVIYGANASGKTNIIGAMDTFKRIIHRGHIRNSENQKSHNTASGVLELIPNNASSEAEPISFSVQFVTEGLLIEYAFSMLVGRFLETDYPRKVCSEYLLVNNVEVFHRDDELYFNGLDSISAYLVNAFPENADSAVSIAKSNLNDEELFLMNGFKTMFSAKIASIIDGWLTKKLITVYRSNDMSLSVVEKISDSIVIDKTLNDAVKLFGINSNDMGFMSDSDGGEARLHSLFEDSGKAVRAEVFESYGTLRFAAIFPMIAGALQTGSTLVVDEFDASIHPMALMNIVNIFHNDEINTRNAQLIFNTHNPIFLNSNFFRRDEIKFVERDDITHASTHYSLSDFGTAGDRGVRKGDDYMKKYFVDRYGAIRDIDFSSVIESLTSSDAEVQS